ncbi:MAG: O-methyltransferase [Lachnospiraceae bacterium]|nr:O-methyltransferase [Lachnospiraceae bacterium]
MEERFAVFAAAMAPGNPPLLRALEEKARADGVPVIRQGTQSLIRFLLELKKPQRILEVGTGVGFSALLMLDALHGACEITTIEKDPARAAEAERNFAEAGGKIRLFRGDAEEILRQLAETEPESYDFVFMDAAKGQYIHFLPRIVELTRAGGLLLSDNILKEGEILESRYGVTRRDRTIHARMREYLLALCRSDDWRTVLLEEGDGTALSVRI